MKKLVMLLLILAMSMKAIADQNSDQSSTVKVLYQRNIPFAIRLKMPVGSHTRFFGTNRSILHGTLVAFHIYELPLSTKGYSVYENAPFYMPHCVLDIFTQDSASRHLELRRINSIHFDSAFYSSVDFSHAYAFKVVGIDCLWLDPQKRKIPILNVNFLSPEGYYQGTNILVVFPIQIDAPPRIQGFGYGTSNANGGGVWRSTFDHIDQRGLLQVLTTHGENPDLGDNPQWLSWNGKAFVPNK